MMDDVEQILGLLARRGPGRLAKDEIKEIESHLSRCWHLLSGSDQDNMSGAKLAGRTEVMEWEPPTLRFQIERHGATVKGSTRGEVHRWEVDLELSIANVVSVTTRQLRPVDARMDVGAIADAITSVVTGGGEDDRIKRRKDSVEVLTAQIIPYTNNLTTAERRRRFVKALEQRLAPRGWLRKPAGSHLVFEFQTPE